MNIQHRTGATLSLPGLSTTPELARTARNEGQGAREGLLAVTYEHVGVGIVEVDEAGRMLRVKVCELMGREAANLLGRSIFDETFPQDVAQDLGQFRRQVAVEIDRYTIEKRLVRNGKWPGRSPYRELSAFSRFKAGIDGGRQAWPSAGVPRTSETSRLSLSAIPFRQSPKRWIGA